MANSDQESESESESESELLALVRALVQSENDRDATNASHHLAAEFVGITRAGGVERTRAQLLEDIANPQNLDVLRTIDESSLQPTVGDDLGFVRSIVVTSSRADANAPKRRFRNLHAFRKEVGTWRCVAWQVTELKG